MSEFQEGKGKGKNGDDTPSPKTELAYYLPKSVLRFEGTVLTKLNLRTDEEETYPSGQMSVVTVADRDHRYSINFEDRALSNESLIIGLSNAGLLTSANAESTGQLPGIISGLLRFGVSLIGTFFGFSGRGAPPVSLTTEGGGDPVEDKYKTDHPEKANARDEVRGAIREMGGALISLYQDVAKEKDAANRAAILKHCAHLVSALKGLMEEAKPLDEHFEAWRARKEQARETRHVFEVGIDDLLIDDDLKPGDPIGEQLSKTFKPIYETFGIVVTRPKDPWRHLKNGAEGGPGERYAGVFYRPVTPVTLSFYEKPDGPYEIPDGENEKPDRPKLVKTGQETVYVFGEKEPGFIEFGKTKWSKETAKATFGPEGALTELSSTKGSALAAAAEAAKGLPTEVKAALTAANEIVDEAQKLSLQNLDQRVAQLKKEKELVQAEIALGTALDNRARTEELARLNAEIGLLEKRKTLGTAQRELDSEEALGRLALKKQLTQLELEVEKIRLERMKLEAQLAED